MHTGTAPALQRGAGVLDVPINSSDTNNKWNILFGMKLYTLWMLYVALGVVMLGFDWSCYPNLLAFQSFSKKYGEFDAGTKSYIVASGRQAAWNGGSSGGQVVGGLVSGFIMDRWGRRNWLLVLSCLGVLSIGIVYYAPDWKVLAAGRVLQGKAPLPRRSLR